MNASPDRPCVLVIAGHDPSGGAGVQADIETLLCLGCRPVTLLTLLTAQSASSFVASWPQPGDRLRRQADVLLAGLRVDACKIGALGNAELAGTVASILKQAGYPPSVLDPVLASATHGELADTGCRQVMLDSLLPHAAVVTPNREEALALTGVATAPQAAAALLERGAGHVLVTGVASDDKWAIDALYAPGGGSREYRRRRLPGVFHGSGCTLSAAVAAGLARGWKMHEAVERAQAYTWQALRHAGPVERGQAQPERFYWHTGGDPA